MPHFGKRTLKPIIYLLSALCAILAVILIFYGDWLLGGEEDIKIDHGENLAGILTIVLATVILLNAAFGSLALYKESKGMLIAYAVILVVLLIIQLILVSISYTAGNATLSTGLQKGFDELWDGTVHTNSTLSQYEQWLECCGKHSAEDYFLLDKVPPQSCCKEQDCTNVLNLFVVGCEQKFKEHVRAKTARFNTVSWFLIIFEFICSIICCKLVDNLRNHQDRIRFYN